MPEADPGFQKEGGPGGSGAHPQDFLGNLGDILKKLAQKGVACTPASPPHLDPRLNAH